MDVGRSLITASPQGLAGLSGLRHTGSGPLLRFVENALMQDAAKTERHATYTERGDALTHGRSSSGSGPRPGDVLIRDFAASTPGEFIIADATTLRRLEGPFGSLMAAAAAARALSPARIVWRENVDSRGRAVGPPIPLPRREP
jgi:hypothetical protein